MGTISNFVQNVKFSAGQAISSITDKAQSVFESIVGTVSAAFDGLVTGDVVGIDATQVPQMKQAISSYVEEL